MSEYTDDKNIGSKSYSDIFHFDLAKDDSSVIIATTTGASSGTIIIDEYKDWADGVTTVGSWEPSSSPWVRSTPGTILSPTTVFDPKEVRIEELEKEIEILKEKIIKMEKGSIEPIKKKSKKNTKKEKESDFMKELKKL